MNPGSNVAFIAFEGDRCIASGDLRGVVRAARETLDRRKDASIPVFDGITSGPVEIDSVSYTHLTLPTNREV